MAVLGPFLAILNTFQKTEVQTVILKCSTGLNLNWLESYDTKSEHFHFQFFAILLKKLFFYVLYNNFYIN